MPTSSQNYIDTNSLGTSHVHGLQSYGALSEPFDVVVIGSGAAGAVVANIFVKAGLRTLVLEDGAKLKSTARNKDVDADSDQALAGNAQIGWCSKGWPWSTINLGGGTIFYGGASFRYTDFDFDPSEHIRVEGLPVKWPIDACDLAPFYSEMESALSIDHTQFQCLRREAPQTLSMPGEYLWKGALSLEISPQPAPLAIDRSRCDHCSLCI